LRLRRFSHSVQTFAYGSDLQVSWKKSISV